MLFEGAKNFSKVTPKDRELFGKLHGKNDLLAFSRFINKDFQDAKHIKAIVKALSDIESGKKKRLIINMPPRHGKSELGSKIFPLWALGKNPKREIIVSSYNKEKAEEFTGWQKNVCENDERFIQVFPDCLISKDFRAKDQWQTTAGGGVVGAGIGGSFTGRGSDIFIIDDPTKNYEEAISETIQEAIWNWYRSVVVTRLSPDAAIILIMTRWVSNDLAGRVIEGEGLTSEGGEWDILKLPAINTQGEALWSNRFDIERLYKIRKAVGEKFWAALYQQEPVDLIERIFSDPVFDEAPVNIKKVCYLDPAFGGKDYTAFCIGGLVTFNDDTQLLYVTHGDLWQSQIDETYNRVERIWKSSNAGTITVENNQAQKAVAAELRRRGIPVKEVTNTTNKHLRIVNACKLNWDNIRFSRNVSEDFMKQILTYSELAKHDDAADALAGLIDSMSFGRARMDKRFDGFLDLFSRWW